MALPSLGHCDHILHAIDSPHVFRKGPRSSLAEIKQTYASNPDIVLRAVNNTMNPFDQEHRRQILDRLSENREGRVKRRYASFEGFCFHVSRHRYVPTNDLIVLLRGTDVPHADRQELALTILEINASTLRKISRSCYIAQLSGGGIVFINRTSAVHAHKITTILRIAFYVLCWASSFNEMPTNLRYKALTPPPIEFARELSRRLALEARAIPRLQAYSFYARNLIPAVAESVMQLYMIISSTYGRPSSESSSDEHSCLICMGTTLSNELTVNLACGHSFHQNCISDLRRHNGSASVCPICRAPLSVITN